MFSVECVWQTGCTFRGGSPDELESLFGYVLMRQLVQVVARRLQATRLQLLDIYKPRAVKLI